MPRWTTVGSRVNSCPQRRCRFNQSPVESSPPCWCSLFSRTRSPNGLVSWRQPRHVLVSLVFSLF
ncbi:unnamed protein product, partial [Dibothriocephalus latus]